MLEKVYSLEDEMTFYAHTKGVSYFKTIKPILTWTESMYKFNLKYVDKLDEILKHDLLWDAETCLKFGLIDEII